MNSQRLCLPFIFVILASALARSESTAITWKTHYGQAKRIAQAAKRPLLVVIEDSNQAENRINENTLDTTSREKLVHQDFELVRVDASTEYGKRVAQAFGVRRFPYTAVTDRASRRIVFRKSGPMSKSDWTVALARSSTAVTGPTSQPVLQIQPVNTNLFMSNGSFQFPAQQCFT